MPVTDRGWPEKAGVSPGVSDVVRFLIRLQREHTHPHARTHTQTLDTHTLPADVWRMLFFSQRDEVGGRWGRGGVVSERSRWWQTSSTCERGEMTECRDERRWHWLGRGVRVAGPLFYSLVITGRGGYWYVAGCGGWKHTYLRALAYTLHTQSDSFS